MRADRHRSFNRGHWVLLPDPDLFARICGEMLVNEDEDDLEKKDILTMVGYSISTEADPLRVLIAAEKQIEICIPVPLARRKCPLYGYTFPSVNVV